jgi:hypothetical protein
MTEWRWKRFGGTYASTIRVAELNWAGGGGTQTKPKKLQFQAWKLSKSWTVLTSLGVHERVSCYESVKLSNKSLGPTKDILSTVFTAMHVISYDYEFPVSLSMSQWKQFVIKSIIAKNNAGNCTKVLHGSIKGSRKAPITSYRPRR